MSRAADAVTLLIAWGDLVVATPKDAADDVLARARSLMALANTAPSGTPAVTKIDLRRAAIAMGMAALDTYMHWAVRRTDLQSGSPALRKLDITLGDLIDSSAKSVEARNLEKKDRPGTRVRNILNERILSETFQSPKGFESAMAMVGVKKCWTKIAPLMPGTPTASELQQRLGRIYHDRNTIVHEGDLLRLVRPQKVGHYERSHADVKATLDWIEAFIAAVDQIAS